MTELTQIPDNINITVALGDSFTSLIDFDIDLTAYVATAVVNINDGTAVSFTVVDTDLSAGQVTISLTAAQITTIGAGNHRWYFKYVNGAGSLTRRTFSGTFTVLPY